MVTILISVVIGIIIALIRTIKHEYDYDDIIAYVINCFAGAALGFFAGLLIAFCLPMKTYEKHYSYNIENLNDNSNVKGSFFLGCGQIKGNMKYVFYYEENDGFKMKQLDVDEVIIKYTDGKPKINVTEISLTKAKINLFALDSNIGHKSYVIEVPKGSIKQNYNLDAQ